MALTFPVSDSITPDWQTNRTIAGVRLRSPQGSGLAGAAPAMNTGLGPAPTAPPPQLATAAGVQGLAQQQGIPLGNPTPAPVPKLGGENYQVAKSALGARPAAQKKAPLRSTDLFGMLRGSQRRPVKRANLLTPQQPGLTAPYLQNVLGMNDPERLRMNQLLGVESQLAAGQGAAENPSQDPLEDLELQKTVLSREVSMPPAGIYRSRTCTPSASAPCPAVTSMPRRRSPARTEPAFVV